MCYYATTDYACGDWKWGNMMERCPRQHRIGETCGAKLIHHESVTKSLSNCKVCDEIKTKERRLAKTQDNIQRWSREPDKFSASLEKAQRDARELIDKIKELQLRRASVATKLKAAPRQQSSTNVSMLPPLGSAAYEYQSSQPNPGRRQDSGMIPRNTMMPPSNGGGGVRTGQTHDMTQYLAPAPPNHSNRQVSMNHMTVPQQNVTYARRRQ